MANSITWAIRRFLRLDGRNDRGKAGPPSRHRGFTIHAEPARPAMCARASPAQPPADLASLFLARAQPLLPLPPASQSRLPSRCRACVDATDANSAAHSPGNSGRGPAVYDDDDISHPALASAISPSRPGPTFPSPPSPPVPPIKSHLSSSANAAAAPRQRPGRLADLHAQPCPPLPTRLDRSADSSTSSHHRVSCHEA